MICNWQSGAAGPIVRIPRLGLLLFAAGLAIVRGQTGSFEAHSFAYSTDESLYYESRLSGGPPLILLHGLGLAVESWNKVREPLAENFDVYAIDLRGFGRSSKPGGNDYSIQDQAI